MDDTSNKIQFTKILPLTQIPIAVSNETHSSYFLDPSIRASCFFCQKIMNKTITIKVNDTVICVTCFAKQEPFPQKYSVVGHSEYPLIEETWSASDQLLLLEAIGRHGMGNWLQISEYMKYFKRQFTSDEVRNHYQTFYLNSPSFEPKFCMQLHMNLTLHPEMKLKKKKMEEEKEKKIKIKNNFPSQDIIGYNSKRQQFFRQYDSKLERYIANLEFKQNDSIAEVDAKIQIITLYNQGLANRYEIYDFILDHKLLHSGERQVRERKMAARPFLRKASQMLKNYRKFFKYDEYCEIQILAEDLFKFQKLIQVFKRIRKEDKIKTLQQLSLFVNKKDTEVIEKKPRKKVHKNVEDSKEEEQKEIMKKLGLTQKNLNQLLEMPSSEKSFQFKGLKVTLLNN